MSDPGTVLFGNLPLDAALLVIMLLLAAALVLFALTYRRLVETHRLYRRLYQSAAGHDLDGLFKAIEERLSRVDHDLEALQAWRREVSAQMERCYQGLGVVRFNAFEGVGSDLSFSVALLDGQKNGVVLTSLFGRDASRIYAKPLLGGESSYQLTAEEKEAVQMASQPRGKKSIRQAR